jgi:hypothetical protein
VAFYKACLYFGLSYDLDDRMAMLLEAAPPSPSPPIKGERELGLDTGQAGALLYSLIHTFSPMITRLCPMIW